MLQLRELNVVARAALRTGATGAPGPEAGSSLPAVVDAAVDRLRASRHAAARARGGIHRLAEACDRAIRTDAREHLDDPEFPEEARLRIVRGVHAMNVATFSYPRFLRVVAPMLREVAAREGRPARLLELGSGGGGFALELAGRVARGGLPVVVEGSDVAPIYVDAANRAARARGVPVSFRVVDAMDARDVATGAYDVVFLAQSMHHFSPGQLAAVIREAGRIATTAFVGIDGYRSVGMLAFVAGTSALSLRPSIVHDAVVTARKFYPEAELQLVAEMASPAASVALSRSWINTVLTVRFDAAPAAPVAS